MKHIFGKQMKVDAKVDIKTIIQKALNNEPSYGIVEGEIYTVRQNKTRTGKWRIVGEFYDGKEEIGFQTFLEVEDHPNGAPIKEGYYVMAVEAVNNQYTNNEWALNIHSLASIPSPFSVEKDNAEVTRVELTAFLQMSRMRSRTSYEDYFAHAAALGHTHVGVSDINSVQGFPSAHAAAKKYGIKPIYGATLSLASEDNKILYGPSIDQDLEEAIYCGFDVETEGLSAVNDKVIEIGATKVHKGKVIDRFQAFISGTHVSDFTNSLTGITQEMVDTKGVPLKEAIDSFEQFIEGTVLVAHNATFDRDFISEAFKQVGKELGERSIIDTLEIARSLFPTAAGNRLNNVAKRYNKALEETLKELRKEEKVIKKTFKDLEKEITKLQKEAPKAIKAFLTSIKKEKLVDAKQHKQLTQDIAEAQLATNSNPNQLAIQVIKTVIEHPTLVDELEAKLVDLDQNIGIMQRDFVPIEEEFSKMSQQMSEIQERAQRLILENHHRADEDAEVTIHILTEMLAHLKEQGVTNVSELNTLLGDDLYKRSFPNSITVIATNEIGKKNLYKLISKSSQEYLYREPRVTKKLITEYREGLLIGSGSHEGPLFEVASKKPLEQAMEEASFYDFIEIQPSDIASHLVSENNIGSQEHIELAWKKIYAIGKKLEKPVVATGHVHYLNNTVEDQLLHNIIIYHESAKTAIDKKKGRKGAERSGRHFRTTEQMKQAFDWLPEAEKEAVVVTNSRAIAEACIDMAPVPDKLYPPEIEGANEELTELTLQTTKSIYGENLPEYVQARLDKELKSIIGNGFGVIYLISQKLVKNSNDNGYLVGSRGSVGSSFVATMTGITEVNPLKPHYVSKTSHWSVFFDHEEIASGFDLPASLSGLLDTNRYSEEAVHYFIQTVAASFGKTEVETIEIMKNHQAYTCPITGAEGLMRDGQDIPFETFLGFKGDKVPDIDLNFSGEYQRISHKYVEELFGEKHVFRAGTIGTVADKMAFGYAASYGEENGFTWNKQKVNRLKMKLEGSKRTTGQHAGGILVVPSNMEPEDFTPVQYPADDESKGIRTSHFDFHSIHDNILKLDILGHDDPTILRILQDLTGIDPKTVAPNNEMSLKLFTAPEEALGIDMSLITAETGTLGVPEFGTQFVQQMIGDTKPTTFADLVKISGLSHGTDVWLGNAKDLITAGTATLKNVIDTRDNIMVYLMQKGLEDSLAFTIMESVRKGKGLKPEWIDEMKKFDVPEWYIESCEKIKYMFPKAHAAAYVLSAMRIAYFKVFHPKEFYAAVLSVRYNQENIREINLPPSELRMKIKDYTAEAKQLEKQNQANAAKKILDSVKAMELMLEAQVRGIEFGDVSIEDSHSHRYIIKDGILIPPFISINGLGEIAAEGLYNEFRVKPFESVEDLRVRSGATKPNIEVLRDFGCLGAIEDVQFLLF